MKKSNNRPILYNFSFTLFFSTLLFGLIVYGFSVLKSVPQTNKERIDITITVVTIGYVAILIWLIASYFMDTTKILDYREGMNEKIEILKRTSRTMFKSTGKLRSYETLDDMDTVSARIMILEALPIPNVFYDYSRRRMLVWDREYFKILTELSNRFELLKQFYTVLKMIEEVELLTTSDKKYSYFGSIYQLKTYIREISVFGHIVTDIINESEEPVIIKQRFLDERIERCVSFLTVVKEKQFPVKK